MGMTYATVCTGIGAPELAAHALGWRCQFMSEIERFPRRVLKHYYPTIPLFGDFTAIRQNHLRRMLCDAVDALIGGTPCQSFSIAGKRLGLDDPRGNLALEYLALALRISATWFCWENVPGVFSSENGDDFAAFISAATGVEYHTPEGGWQNSGIAAGRPDRFGVAWRVLDAQYFGVPQRRRRVFVIGYTGDWRPAAAVLFERESLRGDITPRREKGQTAPTIPSRSSAGGGLGTDFDCDGGLIASDWPAEVAPTLNAHFGSKQGLEDQHIRGGADYSFLPETSFCLNAGAMRRIDSETETLIPTGGYFDTVFDPNQIASKTNKSVPKPGLCHTLPATANSPIAFFSKDYGNDVQIDLAPTLRAMGHSGSHANGGGQLAVSTMMRVRRLIPLECERLQGFPDNFTAIPGAKDGPRYKALGNSMAVPVMHWILSRMDAVDVIKRGGA